MSGECTWDVSGMTGVPECNNEAMLDANWGIFSSKGPKYAFLPERVSTFFLLQQLELACYIIR